MKKIILATLAALAVTGLSSCENVKTPGGNQMVTGSKSYYYAYVVSRITGERYYHISGWAEYGPDGGAYGYAPYVGLELQLVNKDVVYYYEPGLYYMLSKNYNPDFGPVIGE